MKNRGAFCYRANVRREKEYTVEIPSEQVDQDWTEMEVPLPLQPEEPSPHRAELVTLERYVSGNPAEFIDGDLKRWAEIAKARGSVYADYGESLYIPGLGRVMRPWEGAPYSPSQLARAYVSSQGWSWPPVRPSGWRWRREGDTSEWVQDGPDNWGPVPPPAIEFGGPASGSWAYVDLAHAYWQIGRRYPWWVAKPGDRRVLRGKWSRPELIEPLRQVRLNLFGMLTYPGGGVTWIKPDGSTKIGICPPSQAKMANPAWGTAILWTVHAIARDLRDHFDIPLWHTDGALVPERAEAEVIEFLARRWRIAARTKERGSGTVAGAGNYSWRRSYNPEVPGVPHGNLVIPSSRVEELREWWLSYRAES